MSIKDTATGYGWISIALHWLTAVLIVVLLFIGSSIDSLGGDERREMLNRHTSIAIASYVVLLGRLIWRFWIGHPGPLDQQRGFFFWLGKWTHIVMLVALGVMLVSGPFNVWSLGDSIVVFDWFVIPSPIEPSMGLHAVALRLHFTGAVVLFVGILMHLAGVYKHAAFNRDGTFTRMLVAARSDSGGPRNDRK
jgi:cytochrome b561